MIKEIKFGIPVTFNPGGNPISWWSNTFNGTFSAGAPISVMINNNKSIQGNSCHHTWRFPETVVWIKKDGSFGSDRVQTWTQIKDYQNINFAIGGLGLSDYNPEAEGFSEFTAQNIYNGRFESKDFTDVLRETNHSVFGFKDGKFFASIMYGTAKDISVKCAAMGMKHVVLGDGGSWAACNTPDLKLNTHHIQHSLVQITNVIPTPDLTVRKTVLDESTNQEGTSKKWRYFKYEEFENSMDGGANETKHELIDMLDKVREITGSITVTSGFRTEAYNRSVGGSSNSNHLIGNAADIKFDFNGWTVTSLKKLFSGFGFKNIGIYVRGNSFGWIHIDIGNKDFQRWNEGNGWNHYRDSAYKVYSV